MFRISIQWVLVFTIFLFSGCATTENRFKKAEQLNSIAAYEWFINNPENKGELVNTASQRLEDLYYQEARKANKIAEYEEFLSRYSTGDKSQQVRLLLDTLYYERAIHSVYIAELEHYLSISIIESNAIKAKNEIRLRKEKRSYMRIKNSNKENAYREYLQEFPDGEHAGEMRERLEYSVAKSHDTISAYNKYINKYPDGSRINDARFSISRIHFRKVEKQHTAKAYYDYLTKNITAYARNTALRKLKKFLNKDLRKLVNKLENENPIIRAQAAYDIGIFGYKARLTVPFLVELLGDDEGLAWKVTDSSGRDVGGSMTSPELEVQKALAKIKGRRTTEFLIAIMQYDDDRYEWSKRKDSAAIALGMIGDKSAIPPLIDNLKNYRWWTSAKALGMIHDKRVVLPLISALNYGSKQNPHTRRRAAEALGDIGDKRAVKPLIDVLSDEERWDEYTAKSISEALGKLNDKRAIEPLIAQAKKGVAAAAEALGKFGDKRAVMPLVNGLDTFNSDYQKTAAQVLGRFGDKRAVEPILDVLLEKRITQDMQGEMFEALGKLGDKRAIPILFSAVNNEWFINDSKKRKIVKRSIKQIIGINYDRDRAVWEGWMKKNPDIQKWWDNKIAQHSKE